MPLLLRNIKQLQEEGCELATPGELMVALMIETNNDPCTTGCSYFNNGKCPVYLKHHSVPVNKRIQAKKDYTRSHSDQSGLIGGKWAGLTVRQIAAQEGISLNQVRQRKLEGRYIN